MMVKGRGEEAEREFEGVRAWWRADAEAEAEAEAEMVEVKGDARVKLGITGVPV